MSNRVLVLVNHLYTWWVLVEGGGVGCMLGLCGLSLAADFVTAAWGLEMTSYILGVSGACIFLAACRLASSVEG